MAVLGYKLNTEDGKYQVSLYPPQQVNVTQGYGGTYSHFGTLNLDNASYEHLRKISAPFDCKVVSNQTSGGYGIVIYHSIQKVWTPKGLNHVTLVLMHDNNSSRWTVGRMFKQGEHIYDEGDADPAGWTTGIHVHMEVALGHYTDRVRTVEGGRYHIVNQVKLEDVFFINGSAYLSEIPDPQFNSQRPYFTKYEGGAVDPPDPEPDKVKDIMPLYLLDIIKGGFTGEF